MNSNDSNDIACKVVLVGESGVGKTSIIKRYVRDEFSDIMEANINSSCFTKTLEIKKYNKSITFDIWDTAGQEKYRSIANHFFINTSIAILVYDITERESFNCIKNFWYSKVKESVDENIVLCIAANKCELYQDEEVSSEEGEKYAKSIGAIFQLTSCCDNIGITQMFEECGCKYLEKNNLIIENKNGNIKIDKEIKNNVGEKMKKLC